MLTIHADLIHKPTTMRQPVCQIEKIIEISQDEFISLSHHPYANYDFIAENRDLMGKWDGAYHCLLALEKDGNDGILIEAEGYDSIRYGAFVSYARDFVVREMERIAEYLLQTVSPDEETGEISIDLAEISEHTGAIVTDGSVADRMLYQTLSNRPDVADVTTIGDAWIITPTAAQEQAAEGLKLKDVLLLGGMENVYMVHETADVGFVPASYTSMLTDKGRAEHADLLNASVKEIRPGAYGPEIVLTGVDPQTLMDFDQSAANHEHSESMMGPTM